MEARYVVRPDPTGFSVRDLWTGQPATLAGAAQTGLSRVDAEHTADLLNGTVVEPPSPDRSLPA